MQAALQRPLEDRLIAATALGHGCRLVTVDRQLGGLGWLDTMFD